MRPGPRLSAAAPPRLPGRQMGRPAGAPPAAAPAGGDVHGLGTGAERGLAAPGRPGKSSLRTWPGRRARGGVAAARHAGRLQRDCSAGRRQVPGLPAH